MTVNPIDIDWHSIHRVCAPEETLIRVRPAMERAGITRVAEQTWLDSLGIPAYQAVRPYSRTLSVSQGKGLTAALAQASAVMEALEFWIAENVPQPAEKASIGDMRPHLRYEPAELDAFKPGLLGTHMVCNWIAGTYIDGTGGTMIPREFMALDWTCPSTPAIWNPPGFRASTNGLASGNTALEAIYHGLCELIERDCSAQAAGLTPSERRWVDPSTVTGYSGELLDRFLYAQNHVEIVDSTSDLGVPSFDVQIWSPSFPVMVPGSGCDLDSDVALSRALTEAAQARIANIVCLREDYSATFPYPAVQPNEFVPHHGETSIAFADVATNVIPAGLDRAVAELTRRLVQHDLHPVSVDLTPPDEEFVVLKVICPGLRFAPDGARNV